MKVVQVLDALDFGDGVSNDVINKYKLLRDIGFETEIYSKWVNDKVKNYTINIENMSLNEDDILLHHFSGECHCMDEIMKQKCKKILVYHNITPTEFFKQETNAKHCSNGEKQLLKYSKEYDYFLADSQYNAQCLQELNVAQKVDVLPIMVDFEKLKKYKNLARKESSETNFLFVGRIVENKKIEDIIEIFYNFYYKINCNSKLILVGNTECSKNYYLNLISRINELQLQNNVVFTGKVSDEELYHYYNIADVFVCMSEHEGFCIPLLESMYFEIPTIAYESTAITSTMGEAGILIQEKDFKYISKLIYEILKNSSINSKIITAQLDRINKFEKNYIEKSIIELINKWRKGSNFDE